MLCMTLGPGSAAAFEAGVGAELRSSPGTTILGGGVSLGLFGRAWWESFGWDLGLQLAESRLELSGMAADESDDSRVDVTMFSVSPHQLAGLHLRAFRLFALGGPEFSYLKVESAGQGTSAGKQVDLYTAIGLDYYPTPSLALGLTLFSFRKTLMSEIEDGEVDLRVVGLLNGFSIRYLFGAGEEEAAEEW